MAKTSKDMTTEALTLNGIKDPMINSSIVPAQPNLSKDIDSGSATGPATRPAILTRGMRRFELRMGLPIEQLVETTRDETLRALAVQWGIAHSTIIKYRRACGVFSHPAVVKSHSQEAIAKRNGTIFTKANEEFKTRLSKAFEISPEEVIDYILDHGLCVADLVQATLMSSSNVHVRLRSLGINPNTVREISLSRRIQKLNGRVRLKEHETQALKATIENGSQDKAAKALGKSREAVSQNIISIAEKVRKAEQEKQTEHIVFQS